MVKRSESAIVGITNLTFRCFRHDARNFVVIETRVPQEKHFPTFCLFLATTLCKYSQFICLANNFLIEGLSGEKYDSRHVGADVRLLFLLTTRLQCDSFSGYERPRVATLSDISYAWRYILTLTLGRHEFGPYCNWTLLSLLR